MSTESWKYWIEIIDRLIMLVFMLSLSLLNQMVFLFFIFVIVPILIYAAMGVMVVTCSKLRLECPTLMVKSPEGMTHSWETMSQ